MSVRVKICGITSREDALAAIDAGADAIGLNFWPRSKRLVGLDEAASIVRALPSGILTVGVFVDAERADIERTLATLPLGAVQLHGDEPPEACAGFAVPVIKALRGTADVATRAARYDTRWILLDADVAAGFGGTGETFPWQRARGIDPSRLFLAGGLRVDNVAEAVRTVAPWAVDVASGVESSPGRKDPARVRDFIARAKSA